MSSKRLEILQDLQTLLATIRVVNGYQTEIGAHVYYWHDLDFEFNKENIIEFRDPVEEVSEVNLPYQKQLSINIQAIYFTESPLPVGSSILEDIEKCLSDFTVTDGKFLLLGNEKTVETKGKKAIKIKVKGKIVYRENV